MLRVSVAIALAMLAAACGGRDGDYGSAGSAERNQVAIMEEAPMPMAPPPPPATTASMDAMASDGRAAGGVVNVNQQIIQQDQQGGGGNQPAQLIAYTYNYGFQVPPAKMEGLLGAHKAACEAAGPAKCYVMNSQIYGLGQEQSSGNMTLRAAPDWIKTFKGGMADSLKPFDADLVSNSDSADDLTVQIVDSEARLKSMKTMRDRLQELLRDRPGRLSDLLEIEREFARVQSNIDSHESVLAALKLRVAMSMMTLTYQPKYSAASESIWRPLGDAFAAFVPNIARTLAWIVEFVGEILPVVIVLGLLLWALLAFFRSRGKKKPGKANPLAPKAAPPAAGS